MAESAADKLFDYPYRRLATLLKGLEPGESPILTHVGEPQGAPPAFLSETVTRNAHLWSKYPSPRGTPDYLKAVADWITRRYDLAPGTVDAARHVTTACGTREALFQAGILAAAIKRPQVKGKPLIGMPNPAYHVYYGAAVMGDAEPLPVPAADASTNYLPDYPSLSADVLDRMAIAYLCTPSNPTGGVADLQTLTRNVEAARRHGYILALDECYSEIFNGSEPPAGGFDAVKALGEAGEGALDNILVFNSLSKRSSAPGLRCGFVAGQADLIDKLVMVRGYGGAQIPEPLMAAGAALWRDEDHLVANRALYSGLFDLSDEILGDLPGYTRPTGGFFLWLPVTDSEEAAKRLWVEAGVKVLPGRLMSRPVDTEGHTPGDGFIRIALVHDPETVREMLGRVRRVLLDGLTVTEEG
ncbi:aminotransferase class I/II-fold pyridoxal phosphate-dependent enzyme [Hwanghaeella grinnelliae]|uniref:Aminotransferase class I/II-fold pyridoxal phosphate-dependent enzyme n=1 Tax=Hwanghaeella grinnelliae TaxID=2500179 RepID=A0A3S2W911_9PROT|nr:aminotransferase class I/II-fold pyridoxal phosphate-dependent enzyme [Hwanghaeella grinnelliae]RVU36165.1 aminotransferase class I/II-fold pyridoxal phosphate-dependent enzyme [Hwanghaeella grinnelliae]